MKTKLMSHLNDRGSALLFTVIAITSIAVLGTGIYFMTTTSTFSGISANDQNRAYQLAIAGKEYALVNNADASYNRDYTFSNGDKFRLLISGDTITSTGIVKEGTPYEARRTITTTITGFSSRPDISFAKDITSFPQTPPTAQSGFVNVDQSAAQISLGEYQPSKFGSIWFSGNAAQGNCQDGKCDFGTGFRAYFLFKLTKDPDSPTDIPHGFTFAFFNGTDNNKSSAGGDFGMPELLAYGGDSCYSRGYLNACTGFLDPSGKGLHPPKIAIEFDGRQQSGSAYFCHPSFSGDSNSREDGVRNHMAYVFWGNMDACPNRENSSTYDDNRHGNGDDVSDPRNAVSTDSSDTIDNFVGLTPSWSEDWLYNMTKVYAVRIETIRASVMTDGKYPYKIKTWIKRCSSENISDLNACSEFVELSNTKKSYDPDPADPPTLQREIKLDQTSHDKFIKFLFGWTAASGSASKEKLTIRNFQLYFDR